MPCSQRIVCLIRATPSHRISAICPNITTTADIIYAIWPHQSVQTFYTFYQIEGRVPTRAEAREQMNRLLQLVTNPEHYHSVNRVQVGVPLAEVAEHIDRGSGMCTMCLESQEGLPVWELTCGHQFCKCDDGIGKWLAENVYCPLCRADVRLGKK
jgi:hypothetical protein